MSAPVGSKPILSPGNNKVELHGRFILDGSGQAVATTVYNDRFTLARTSAGVYTATLSDKYLRLLSGTNVKTMTAVVTPANRGGLWQIQSEGVSSATPTVVFRHELAALAGAAAVAVDPPNSAVLLVCIVVDRGRI